MIDISVDGTHTSSISASICFAILVTPHYPEISVQRQRGPLSAFIGYVYRKFSMTLPDSACCLGFGWIFNA